MSWQQSAQKTNAKKAAGKVMENLKRKIKCIHMYIQVCVYVQQESWHTATNKRMA